MNGRTISKLAVAAIGGLVIGLTGFNSWRVGVEYDNKVGCWWELADKSSTLFAKSENIDRFVAAFDEGDLMGTYSSYWVRTPDTSFTKNFEALKTLQGRLKEIQTIDPNSFAYQVAIQQITGQEQGEAESMTGVLRGCWVLEYHAPYSYSYVWIWYLLGAGFIGTAIVWSLLDDLRIW